MVCLGLASSACGDGGSDEADATTDGATRSADHSDHGASDITLAPPEEAADAKHEIGDRGSFYLRAADQQSDGRTVVVEEAVFTGTKGWVVVHSHTGGSLGPVIGHSEQLPAGTSTNVTVTFTDPPVASRATVYPMLHVESTGNAEFDFPDGDNAASSADGNVVVFPITIDIE